MSTKPTIAQIAELADVSIATVSRFLNNTTAVKSNTSHRIMEAIKELNYPLPNDFLISNNQKDKRVILINIPSVSNPFYNDVIRGAQEAALRHNYYTLVNVQHINAFTESSFFNLLTNINLCGAIVLNALEQKYFDLLYKTIPFVQCCEYIENQNLVSYTSIDDIEAARKVTNYILSTGRRKIGFLVGPERYKYACHRKLGYLQSLEAADIPLNESWIIQLSELDFNMAVSSTYQLMSQKEHPDAIFAVSDVLAAAAIRGCRNAGLSVPQDVAVTGFDNVDISQATSPSITTINQPKYQLGYMACEFLLERLKNPNMPPKQVSLNTELIIRESTQK
ncbi:MAG: substrate-binding domain-containing protein [Lachnospiraceae bacterium]|nr:substrate-binding domain-containing protein [Lachnospiraceae bacterium]